MHISRAELATCVGRSPGEPWRILTPPDQPNQKPKEYLQAFIRSALSSFRQQPSLGRLVALELTDDPLLSLVFAERMGATIVGLAAGVDVVWGLELLIGRFVGLVMVETGRLARADPKTANPILQGRLLGVSSTEFPTLKQARRRSGPRSSSEESRTI